MDAVTGGYMQALVEIKDRVLAGQRISSTDAAILAEHADDALLAELATSVKARFHPTNRATYIVMAIVNYTNVCVAKCDYCAFYRLPHQEGTYLLSFDEVAAKIEALAGLGGRLVGFNGGFHPKLKLTDYAELFAKTRAHFGPRMEFYEMTVAEFMFSCKLSKLTYAEGAALMRQAGTRWITGGGAEILEDGFRMRHSPGKYKVADYFAAQQAILEAGMGSTATMVIGFDETLAERLSHLSSLRAFQDKMDGALPSFLCWTYKPHNNALGGEEISTASYLRWLAVCRIFLDNIPHIRTSVLTKNEDALRGLDFGANDFDLPTEDEVTQKAGATIEQSFDKVLAAARSLGHEPVLREPFPVRTVPTSLSLPLAQQAEAHTAGFPA